MSRLSPRVSSWLLVPLLALVAGCDQGGLAQYGGVSHYRPPPATTRAESFHGLQVQVPVDWGLATLGCAEPAHPYVARPAPACHVRPTRLPARESVWLGSPLPVGQRAAHGLAIRTVRRAGVRLTVATRDPAEARTILRSATAVTTDAHGCARRPAPAGIFPDEGIGEVYGFAACVYADEDGPLLWSGDLDPRAGQRFVAAEKKGRRLRGLPYRDGRPLPVVVLVVTADPAFGTFASTVYYVVKFAPGRVFGGPGLATVALDRSVAEPWLVGGVRRYVPAALLP